MFVGRWREWSSLVLRRCRLAMEGSSNRPGGGRCAGLRGRSDCMLGSRGGMLFSMKPRSSKKLGGMARGFGLGAFGAWSSRKMENPSDSGGRRNGFDDCGGVGRACIRLRKNSLSLSRLGCWPWPPWGPIKPCKPVGAGGMLETREGGWSGRPLLISVSSNLDVRWRSASDDGVEGAPNRARSPLVSPLGPRGDRAASSNAALSCGEWIR